MVLAPVVRGRRGSHRDVLTRLRKSGLVKARIDGDLHDLENLPELNPRQSHDIDGVVDRLVVRTGLQTRLQESVRLAAEQGEGRVVTVYATPDQLDHWREELFSTRYACPSCQISYMEIEPRCFSFHSPYGVCPYCEGYGRIEAFDPDLVIPDADRSMDSGALAPWRASDEVERGGIMDQVAKFVARNDLTLKTPWKAWSASQRDALWQGHHDFPGLAQVLQEEWATSESRRTQLAWFRRKVICPACHGSRLQPEARSVRLFGLAIHEIAQQSLSDTQKWFAGLSWQAPQESIAIPIVRNILRRLNFLEKVGVGYLSLDRAADTLSGGELQRVRLASSIGSGLVGVCYILDEPSVGLHPYDNDRLLDSIRELQTIGNSVIVVEHDLATIRSADHVIDLGPGAGEAGGNIIAFGSPESVEKNPQSCTGRYLAGVDGLRMSPKQRVTAQSGDALILVGATLHNLRSVSVHIPLGRLTCVTGVSGSGKSSLIDGTLAPALLQSTGTAADPGPYSQLQGADRIDKVIRIDQQPIGRSPRSNPATYTGIFDEIRKVFATTRDARQRGYGASRFSFNVQGGRCEACQGHGQQKYEMHFLPDVYVECDQCRGARFNAPTLQVRYREKSIADVLAMRVSEASEFFANFVNIARYLTAMQHVGLSYVPLGQSSTTLSGGEAQRIKLATELARVDSRRTMYVLDEPTTGLHGVDVQRLLVVLQQLVEKGNTVIVVEHHLDVIRSADWIIDLGPGGGRHGGQLVGEGPPEAIAAIPESVTGKYLRAL